MTAPARLLAERTRRLWAEDPGEWVYLLGQLVQEKILNLPDDQLAGLVATSLAADYRGLGNYTLDAAEQEPTLVPVGLRGQVDQADTESKRSDEEQATVRLGLMVAAALTGGAEVTV